MINPRDVPFPMAAQPFQYNPPHTHYHNAPVATTIGYWTLVGKCENCGMPVWARDADGNDATVKTSKRPITKRTCRCAP